MKKILLLLSILLISFSSCKEYRRVKRDVRTTSEISNFLFTYPIIPISIIGGALLLMFVSYKRNNKKDKIARELVLAKANELKLSNSITSENYEHISVLINSKLTIQKIEVILNNLIEINKISAKILPNDFVLLTDFIYDVDFNAYRDIDSVQNVINKKVQVYVNHYLLVNKYGNDIGEKLYNKESWIGMTKEQVIDSYGTPTDIQIEVLKTKTKEILIYGNKSSGEVFTCEDGIVSKFKK